MILRHSILMISIGSSKLILDPKLWPVQNVAVSL